MTFADLYHPPDVTAAAEAWKASCGPAALAAVLQRPLAQVRPLLAGYDQRGSMNPTHMQRALNGARCWWQPLRRGADGPSYGLAFVQWLGPWCNEGVPVAVAYRYTHWVGVAFCHDTGLMLYDINASSAAREDGAWVPWTWWHEEVRPLITETLTGATGGSYIRWSCEARLAHNEGDVHGNVQ